MKKKGNDESVKKGSTASSQKAQACEMHFSQTAIYYRNDDYLNNDEVVFFDKSFEARYEDIMGSPDAFDLKGGFSQIFGNVPADYLSDNATDKGISFHYIIRSNGSTNYFSYAMSLWKYDENDEVERVAIPTTGYIIFTETGVIAEADWNNVEAAINSYKNSVKVLDNSDNAVLVNTIPKHPLQCYYKGSEVKMFLDHNSMTNGHKIVLRHGANMPEGADVPNLPSVQTCILICKKLFLQLDNTEYADVYHKKALDVGRLCPPQCKKL